ncbi:hypothetical protein CAPTEDRAFT_215018 [Capitella teleta]|uniref:Reverse transcriptase domain-containing protein n=1 Tax=Capitella teleta TaxID=283909 RepID=R7TF86_CAPTE|nr:hypothetical protein CAPTEDRAFT_215018 [Capitella teleta]|eukprot:ELT92157.1 hypothetical protein CAPTEDRAFT_215018 [Capitella teleta]
MASQFEVQVLENSDGSDRSLFWHWIWCECGRPNTGALYEAMKRSRHQYHYAVRLARKNEFATKKNSLAEKIKSGADFWRELQKINPCSKMTPRAIDDADSPHEIADIFGKKYSELYTSVPTDADEMARMRAIFSENSAREDPRLVFCTAEDICLVLRKLKSGKGDGSLGFDSDHIINGSSMLFLLVCRLFNLMISHGYVPHLLLQATVISIPKDTRASLCKSDNYRGIALCNSIGKLFDLMILEKFESCFYSSDMQFGFKRGMSTTLCIATLRETMHYFSQRGSDAFVCFLDATVIEYRTNA